MHSTCLAAELVRRFADIRHENGKPVVQVYGWKSLVTKSFDTNHGPIVAFNILGSDGSPVGCDEVSKLATIILLQFSFELAVSAIPALASLL